MDYLKPKYLVSGLVGTIALGILSSAIWDGLKPLSRFLYEKALYISILGIETFKDGLYQNIAKGYHENVSLEIFTLLNAVLLSFILVTLISYTAIYLRRNGDHTTATHVEKLIKWPRKINKRSFILFLFFYTVFVLTFFTLNSVRTKYENQAVTYYTQLVTICIPYLDEKDIRDFNSKFAQIRNKSDYVSIISDLEEVIEKNELKKPDSNFVF